MAKASQKDKPDTLKFMPIYSSSKQLLLWDTANGVMASYSTEESINSVASFFKNKMPSYGWKLFHENPITQKSADCPACDKKIGGLKNGDSGTLAIKGKFYTSDLKFKREKGEFCSISITSSDYGEVSLPKEAKEIGYTPLKELNTRITVSYRNMSINAQE
jgi:hypothetical protein